ncbi:MAG: NAD(P)-dependent oxidoreductase [Eggerthellaceae bacterium]|nr:NAD(P)-dependent oxidoreductase [Eggerthellaceae bacterium]
MSSSFVFLGVPEVGCAMARNLLEAGLQGASEIGTADVIVTMCARQSLLEDAYYDEAGIIANAHPGAYVIDCSATTPSFARELATMSTVNDLHFVEAPLVVRDCTCADAYADPKNLIALAAGDEADVEAMRSVLEALAGTVHMCGGAGMGQLSKCAITMQQCAQLASLMESDALCRVSGSPQAAQDVSALVVREQLVSPGAQKLYDAMQREDFGEGSGYSVEVLWGELESALAAADEADLIAPHAEAALYLLELLATIGGVAMAPAALKLVYCDEDTVAKYGLDWKRADQSYRAVDYSQDDDFYEEYEEYEDCDDDECGEAHYHDHGFGMGLGGGFGGWSSN